MKAPSVLRILPSTVYPIWINAILDPLNNFIKQVGSGLNKDITFEDNIRSQQYSLTVTTSSLYTTGDFATIRFTKSFKAKAFALFIAQISEAGSTPSVIKEAVSIQWEQLGDQIYINYISGLDDSKSYNVALLLI
jgi:hypothetical protein